jgi:hypothetical protein
MIVQLQQSIASAENTLEHLQEEYEETSLDDRVAVYRELDEEVRETFLELERLQAEIQSARDEADRLELQLKETDKEASPEGLNGVREEIERIKGLNRSLRKKWQAYHENMHRMNIETRITANRQAEQKSEETIREADQEYHLDVGRLNELADVLDGRNAEYQRNVEELMNIIDQQRRRIVQHLMGRTETVPGNGDAPEEEDVSK